MLPSNVYPLHHAICAPAKLEVASSKGLGEDIITRNVMNGSDGWVNRQTDGPTFVLN